MRGKSSGSWKPEFAPVVSRELYQQVVSAIAITSDERSNEANAWKTCLEMAKCEECHLVALLANQTLNRIRRNQSQTRATSNDKAAEKLTFYQVKDYLANQLVNNILNNQFSESVCLQVWVALYNDVVDAGHASAANKGGFICWNGRKDIIYALTAYAVQQFEMMLIIQRRFVLFKQVAGTARDLWDSIRDEILKKTGKTYWPDATAFKKCADMLNDPAMRDQYPYFRPAASQPAFFSANANSAAPAASSGKEQGVQLYTQSRF